MALHGLRGRATRATVVAVTVLAVAALAGCSPKPVPTHSPTTVPTDPGDNLPIPGQPPVAPPTSRHDALTAASRTVRADYAAVFDIFANKVSGRSMRNFEAGSSLKNTEEFIDAIGDEPNMAGGISGRVDLWLPDYSASSVATLTSGGKSHRFGVAHLFGCQQIRGKLLYTSDPPTEAVPEFIPYEYTVEYRAAKRIWLITRQAPVSGNSAAALCPAAGS